MLRMYTMDAKNRDHLSPDQPKDQQPTTEAIKRYWLWFPSDDHTNSSEAETSVSMNYGKSWMHNILHSICGQIQVLMEGMNEEQRQKSISISNLVAFETTDHPSLTKYQPIMLHPNQPTATG